jgi:hypothetical protein
LQAAKKQTPVSADRRTDPSDDAVKDCRKDLVPLRQLGETDAQFLRRLNAPLIKENLPRFYGVQAGDSSNHIVGMRTLEVGEYSSKICLLVKSPTGHIHKSLLDVHTDGHDELAVLVVPFVRASDGEIYVLVTRESRYALYLDKQEMTEPRETDSGEVGKPRKGYLCRFAQAFAASAKFISVAGAKLKRVPVRARRDRTKLSRAAKAVIGRKVGQVLDLPGVEPVEFTFLDRGPENPGASGTWIHYLAFELKLNDPKVERALLWGDPDNKGLKLRVGPAAMKSKFVPVKDLFTKKGRHKHDMECAITLSAITMFREALDEGRLAAKRRRRANKSETK